MDAYIQRYIEAIKYAYGSDDGLEIVINRIYDEGFNDGTQTTLEEVREGQWKEEVEAE